MLKTVASVLFFLILSFDIVSEFDIRISSFLFLFTIFVVYIAIEEATPYAIYGNIEKITATAPERFS